MTELDRNLAMLRRKVELRVEHLLIVRHGNVDPAAFDRPALPMLDRDEPLVIPRQLPALIERPGFFGRIFSKWGIVR